MDRYTNQDVQSSNDIVVVSRGTDSATGRAVILRSFKERGLSEGVKEVEALRKLAPCPFVVNLVERIQIQVQNPPPKKDRNRDRTGDPNLIVVSEALEMDLASYLERHVDGLPVETVRIFAFQLLSALDAIHSAEIYLRDLRPAKIRVSEEEMTAKIASDFTAAKMLLSYSKTDELTPPKDFKIEDLRYQPPEVLIARSKKSYNEAMDMWSLGCIIVEMARGTVPFAAKAGEQKESLKQLVCILSVLGTPLRNPWPGLLKEALWEKFPMVEATCGADVASTLTEKLGPHGIDLIEQG